MNDAEKDIESCIETLQRGGVILYPTDTVWGLGCDATDQEAVSKIFRLKKREEAKSLIVLLSDPKELRKFTGQNLQHIQDYLEKEKTPITVVFESAKNLADNVIHHDGTVGIRVTNDPFCKALIQRFGKPIVSTSANLSGNPTPSIFMEIEKEIIEQTDYVVKYRQSDDTRTKPSRIVKLSETGEIIILRN